MLSNIYYPLMKYIKTISPHVSIYRFPSTAISSIFNRITGVAMSGLFITTGTICFIDKEKILYDTWDKQNRFIKQSIKTGLAFPFTFHTIGGIRHFLWDKYPTLLSNKNYVNRSSTAIFFSSFILSGIIGRFS